MQLASSPATTLTPAAIAYLVGVRSCQRRRVTIGDGRLTITMLGM